MLLFPTISSVRIENEDKMTQYKEVRTSQHEDGQEKQVTSFKVTQIIWWLLGFLEAILALRFIFKLIGVNAANPFATFLYNLSGFFVKPFASLTGAPEAAGMVFEFSTLLAMVIYGLVGFGIERLVYVFFYRPRGNVSTSQTTLTNQMPEDVSGSSQTDNHNNQI